MKFANEENSKFYPSLTSDLRNSSHESPVLVLCLTLNAFASVYCETKLLNIKNIFRHKNKAKTKRKWFNRLIATENHWSFIGFSETNNSKQILCLRINEQAN